MDKTVAATKKQENFATLLFLISLACMSCLHFKASRAHASSLIHVTKAIMLPMLPKSWFYLGNLVQ